jgi:hypothetical protein
LEKWRVRQTPHALVVDNGGNRWTNFRTRRIMISLQLDQWACIALLHHLNHGCRPPAASPMQAEAPGFESAHTIDRGLATKPGSAWNQQGRFWHIAPSQSKSTRYPRVPTSPPTPRLQSPEQMLLLTRFSCVSAPPRAHRTHRFRRAAETKKKYITCLRDGARRA